MPEVREMKQYDAHTRKEYAQALGWAKDSGLKRVESQRMPMW